jgi:hypothetical protein
MPKCPHCPDDHPENARFCAATGNPLPGATERVRPLGNDKGAFDLLREAIELYRTHARELLPTAAVLFVPGALVVSFAAPSSGSTLGWMLGKAVTALVLYGVVLPLTHAALVGAAVDRLLGGDAGWREHWAMVVRRLPLLVSALAPAALLLAAGFFLAMIPGLVLAFFFVFVTPVVLIEGVGGTQALWRSFALVRSDWLRTAAMLLTFGVANALLHWVAGLFLPARATGLASFAGNLLLLVVMPVPLIATALLYLDLRRKVDGADEESLRGQLEGLRPPG